MPCRHAAVEGAAPLDASGVGSGGRAEDSPG